MSWGSEGPPPEAYGRVTNAERFAPLHEHTRALLDALERRYLVDRVEGWDLDPELRSGDLARPTARLVPQNGGAPLTVAFTSFPGVCMRIGRFWEHAFPACGCDACAETVHECQEQMQELVDRLVSLPLYEEVTRTTDKLSVRHAFARDDGTVVARSGESWPADFADSSEHPRIEALREALDGNDRWFRRWEPWERRGDQFLSV